MSRERPFNCNRALELGQSLESLLKLSDHSCKSMSIQFITGKSWLNLMLPEAFLVSERLLMLEDEKSFRLAGPTLVVVDGRRLL